MKPVKEAQPNSPTPSSPKEIDWPVMLFLTILPVIAIVSGTLYLVFAGWIWPVMIFSFIFAAATNLSITAGYHRLFAHRSYEAHPLMKFIYVFIGSSAWQGSVLRWAIGHRRHHAFEDTDKDPYNINQGFWYAHMGWMFVKHPSLVGVRAPDLEKDWLLRFQDKHYVICANIAAFGFPLLIGWLMGHPWGGLIMGGFVRVVLTQQSTYFINSLCHYWGRQTFEKDITARDSLLLAILTHGEGYHNFHHKFQTDYRNGHKWYQWDPTKWTIWFLSLFGLAKKLKRIPPAEILKARLQMEELILKSKGYSHDKLEQLKERMIQAQLQIKKLKEDYAQLKKQLSQSSQEKLAHLKAETKLAHVEFKTALEVWQSYLKAPVVLG